MDPRSLRVPQDAYFSLLTHTKKLLLVSFCDTTAKIGLSFWTHRTDLMVEMLCRCICCNLICQWAQSVLHYQIFLGSLKVCLRRFFPVQIYSEIYKHFQRDTIEILYLVFDTKITVSRVQCVTLNTSKFLDSLEKIRRN